MLRLVSSGKAESYCVDGDIKRVAGNLIEAAVAYLNGHIADSQYTLVHLDGLDAEQKDEITAVLEGWLKADEESRAARKKHGVKAAPDEIWSFVFALQPQAVTTCFARIEPLLKEKRYKQVIDSCSAILNHYPNAIAPILLQRGIAYSLIGGHEKQAISDYLRAFIKDKEATIQVTRSKHGQHLPQITDILSSCVYSEAPSSGPDSKPVKRWLQLTADCCKLLITLNPNNFQLQMTYSERLTMMSKLEQAIGVVNETIGVLQLDLEPSPRKFAECWLRLGHCYFLKSQTDIAVSHITRGLNAASDYLTDSAKNAVKSAQSGDQETGSEPQHHRIAEHDITMTFLEDHHEVQFIAKLAREILGGKSGDLNELYGMLDKTASKVNPPEKIGGVMKLDSVRQALDLHRAILVFKPKHRATLIKLALCYSKLGRHNFAIKIYDFLLSKKDYAQDNSILSARAACYRELGKKVEARKDYDILLRDSPKDAALLFERSLVHMENKDIDALVADLQTACKSNQRTVSIYMNKLPLAQRTRIRQILFEHAKSLLQEAKMPDIEGGKSSIDQNTESSGSMALAIAQLLTKLNTADHAAHIIKAHALFFIGSFNDADVSLKRLLNDNPENPDNHMIKLHLGLLRIFTHRTDDGMSTLVEVLNKKGERVVSSLLRDIPVSERARLADEAHRYSIDILQKSRDQDVVQQAAHCFTIAILCCRGTDLILEGQETLWNILFDSECLVGIRRKSDKMSASAWSLAVVDIYDDYKPPKPSIFSGARVKRLTFDIKRFFLVRRKEFRLNGGTGVCRSYLARGECMAHLGDQQAAIYDFSAALEVNPGCVEGLCGRAFMRLALGDEQECVEDIIAACELDTFTVTAHISALPEEAKKLLLFWLDHRVVSILLNYGHKDRLGTGGSASTISIADETVFNPGYEHSRQSSLTLIQPPSPNTLDQKNEISTTNEKNSTSPVSENEALVSNKTTTNALVDETQFGEAGYSPDDGTVHTPTNKNALESVAVDVHIDPEDEDAGGIYLRASSNKRRFHKSSASTRDFGEVLGPMKKSSDDVDNGVKNTEDSRSIDIPDSHNDSRESTAATRSSSFAYDDVITGMEKAELLQKSQLLGKVLIALEPANAGWHGMYADILIMKGDFDEALRHLHVVMQLTPADVTAIARAGLINVKQNRYRPAISLLSILAEVDNSGLLYVLKALDTLKRRMLSEEAYGVAETMTNDEKYDKAVEYYGLSLCASDDRRVEKLRKRAKCFLKLRESKRAVEDMTLVIKETGRRVKAGDYCTRAHIYLLDNKEKCACQDYMKALKIDRDEACLQIHAKPGRTPLSRVFYRQALDEFGRQNYQECMDLCDNGVVIDANNIDIRKLRARAKREVASCSIQ